MLWLLFAYGCGDDDSGGSACVRDLESLTEVAVTNEPQLEIDGSVAIPYKVAPERTLYLHVFEPAQSGRTSGIVFFFGGGFVVGSPIQFAPHARRLAPLGVLAASAEYRLISTDGTTIADAIEDGRDAVRFLREHADELCISTDRVAASGGSAGGFIAASTELARDQSEPPVSDASARANALVLFNPLTPPLAELPPDAPPTVIFHGEEDTTAPIELAESYCDVVGDACELVSFPGEEHGFFNFRDAFEETLALTAEFLRAEEFIPSPSSR